MEAQGKTIKYRRHAQISGTRSNDLKSNTGKSGGLHEAFAIPQQSRVLTITLSSYWGVYRNQSNIDEGSLKAVNYFR